MIQRSTHNYKKGFSLIEILLALFILTVGIIATLTLVTNSVREIADSRESIVAASLAQEGTELVRNIRDNNASDVFYEERNGGGTTKIFDGFRAGECRVFVRNNGAIDFRCDGGTTLIRQSDVLGGSTLYRHGGTETTNYHRAIRIANVVTTGGEIERADVASIVTWGGRGIPAVNADLSNIDTVCTTRTKCVYDRTTLTSWIIHE